MSDSDSSGGDAGWLYCFENPCMPGIYKIGMTTRTPEERLANANSAETWKPPMPYHIVLTKRVFRVREIERTVHSLLEELGMRVHPRREFFRVSLSIVEKVFSLIGSTDSGGDVIEHVVDIDEESMSSSLFECICCQWKGLSHRFPKHAIRYHASSIQLSPTKFSHCSLCYLVSGDKKTMFAICLGCEKGTTSSLYCGNGARWKTRHETMTTCHTKHAECLSEYNFPILSTTDE